MYHGRMTSRILIALVGCLVVNSNATALSEYELARHITGPYERQASEECYRTNLANWARATDLLNSTKEQAAVDQKGKYSKFLKGEWEKYFRDADWENFKDPQLRRVVKLLSEIGVAALDEASLQELNQHQSTMAQIYSTAKICPYTNQKCNLTKEGLALNPDIEDIMRSSTDYDELEYVWKAWRDASGAKMRQDYKKYVELSNLAAVENDYADMGEMWRASFESNQFKEDIDDLWKQVEPLYNALHKYVRGLLRTRYGERMGTDGLIPAHLLGNMWGQTWVNLYDLVVPYPNASDFDITEELKKKKYSPLRMFQIADDFYTSLGLRKNDMSYNERLGAMITKPSGKEVVCHASAWDFCNKKDYRIKMCTKVNAEDFITIHHEMGHIAYDQLYQNQSFTFRGTANPGFTEAIGDTIALSVATPEHLQTIGFLKNYVDDPKTGINALMKTALSKVAFLPFGLLVDKWRWDVFSGEVPETQWNSHWWSLRERLQKVKASVPRSENDFDPGAKYHVPNNSKYISYFVSYIVQFQLHKSLCMTAGQYNPKDRQTKPLHKCDIFHSKKAGSVLTDGLSLGSSKHWSEVLFILTGDRKISGAALLEYFAPLMAFLEQRDDPST